MKLFLQKKCKIFERWGLRPQTPKTTPPLRISGYAPALVWAEKKWKKFYTNFVQKLRVHGIHECALHSNKYSTQKC